MMTPKQERFCLEYMADLNATQAAIRARYSKNTAEVQGSRLLTNVKVQAAIQEQQKRIAHNLGVTAECIVAEYAKLAFSDIAELAEWDAEKVVLKGSSALTKNQTAPVQEITETRTDKGKLVRIKLHDKIRALDSLARHLGMFTDQSETKSTEVIHYFTEKADKPAMRGPDDRVVLADAERGNQAGV